jgi:hypothetical protein
MTSPSSCTPEPTARPAGVSAAGDRGSFRRPAARAAALLLATGSLAAVAALGTAAAGCRCSAAPTPSASTEAARPTGPAAGASSGSVAPYLPPRVVPRVGPMFAILPGEGIGPIRFGATVATVERHMTRPCDVKDETTCRYFAEAVEFRFTDGVVSEIRIHRLDRPAGKDASGVERTYGNFNGAIPADPAAGRPLVTTFGMHAAGVAEGLGPPLRTETLDGSGPNHTVSVQYYDGLAVEFDRVPEAQMPVAGGFRILRPEKK